MQMSARKLSKAFPAKIKMHEDQCFGSRALRMVWEYVKNIWNPKIICFLLFSCVAWDFHQFVSLFLPLSLSLSLNHFLIADFSRFVIFLLTCSKLHIAWLHATEETLSQFAQLAKWGHRVLPQIGSALGVLYLFFFWPTCECARPYNSISDIVLLTDNCAALSCLCATWGWKLLWWMSLTPM